MIIKPPRKPKRLETWIGIIEHPAELVIVNPLNRDSCYGINHQTRAAEMRQKIPYAGKEVYTGNGSWISVGDVGIRAFLALTETLRKTGKGAGSPRGPSDPKRPHRRTRFVTDALNDQRPRVVAIRPKIAPTGR